MKKKLPKWTKAQYRKFFKWCAGMQHELNCGRLQYLKREGWEVDSRYDGAWVQLYHPKHGGIEHGFTLHAAFHIERMKHLDC